MSLTLRLVQSAMPSVGTSWRAYREMKVKSEKLIQLTTSISREDFIRIDALAKRAGKTRSAFVADRLHNDCMIQAEPVSDEDRTSFDMTRGQEKPKRKLAWYQRLFR